MKQISHLILTNNTSRYISNDNICVFVCAHSVRPVYYYCTICDDRINTNFFFFVIKPLSLSIYVCIYSSESLTHCITNMCINITTYYLTNQKKKKEKRKGEKRRKV